MSDDRRIGEHQHDTLPDPSFNENGDEVEVVAADDGTDRKADLDRQAELDGPTDPDRKADLDLDQESEVGSDIGSDIGTGTGTGDARLGGPVVPAQRQSDDADAFGGGASAGTEGYGKAEEAVTAGSTGQRFFTESVTEKLRDRWQSLQVDFVDDPRRSVEQAEDLVEQVSTQLVEAISVRRQELHGSWTKDGGTASNAHDDGVATEDLRTALQDYREVFNQLLAL